MAGSDSAYPKETTLNYVSVASHSVSFAVKIKSKRGKETSSPFLSAFAFFFSIIVSFSAQFGPFLLQTHA